MSKFTHLDAFLLLCSIFTYIVDVALGEHTHMKSAVGWGRGVPKKQSKGSLGTRDLGTKGS